MNTSAEWLPISVIAARLGVEDREVARALIELDLVESRAHSRVDDGVRVYSPSLTRLIERTLVGTNRLPAEEYMRWSNMIRACWCVESLDRLDMEFRSRGYTGVWADRVRTAMVDRMVEIESMNS